MKRSWSPADSFARPTWGGTAGSPAAWEGSPPGWSAVAMLAAAVPSWRPYDVTRLAAETSSGGPSEAIDPPSALAAEDEEHPERRRMRAEAVLFVSKTPLSPRKLAQLAHLADATEARTLVRQLNQTYESRGRAIRVEQIAGGFRMMTRPALAPWLARLGHLPQMVRLSTPMMETLAVVAYRQPVSRASAEAVRGVACGELLRQLMERDLIRIVGRSEELGRPYLYGTTKRFLQLFGLPRLDALPPINWHAMQEDQTNEELTPEDSPADSLISTKELVVSTTIAPTSTETVLDSEAWTAATESNLSGIEPSSAGPTSSPAAVDDDEDWDDEEESDEESDEDWDDEDDWDEEEDDLEEDDDLDDDYEDDLDDDEEDLDGDEEDLDGDEDDLEDDDWEEVDDDDDLEEEEDDEDWDEDDEDEEDESAEDDEDWE